jgi:hypothetical protein
MSLTLWMPARFRTEMAASSGYGTTGPIVPVCSCPLIGADRKLLGYGQNDAFDPKQTCRSSRVAFDLNLQGKADTSLLRLGSGNSKSLFSNLPIPIPKFHAPLTGNKLPGIIESVTSVGLLADCGGHCRIAVLQ